MAPAQQSRVLRCCSCHLFQAHQVKKSLKWTCKACGEKQSFMRVYGEGSGADCRRHVQKLNLLQGQVSELSFRSVDEALRAQEEENAGSRQAKNKSLQVSSLPSESRWLKFLDNNLEEQELGGGASLQTQPSASAEQLDPSLDPAQPKKRKWSQSTEQTSHSLHVQDLENAEGNVEHQGSTGLMGTEQQNSLSLGTALHTRELGFPWWRLPGPTLQVKSPSSKWARFLLSPGNMDTALPGSLQGAPQPADAAQAEQGTPETETPRESCFGRAPAAHIPTSRPERPGRKTPEHWALGTPQAEGGPLAKGEQKGLFVQLQHSHHLFTTGEDFEDDL
uniref:MRN complex interacting protein n=1 Tax=Nannospalax galili TaxID=1026970 RepID=A0A8C6WAB0_NANGA